MNTKIEKKMDGNNDLLLFINQVKDDIRYDQMI